MRNKWSTNLSGVLDKQLRYDNHHILITVDLLIITTNYNGYTQNSSSLYIPRLYDLGTDVPQHTPLKSTTMMWMVMNVWMHEYVVVMSVWSKLRCDATPFWRIATCTPLMSTASSVVLWSRHLDRTLHVCFTAHKVLQPNGLNPVPLACLGLYYVPAW